MTGTCLLCGHEGEDVAVLLDAVDEPQAGLVPTAAADGRVVEVEVLERYVAIARCIDRAACLERRWAAPDPGAVEDPSAWL